MKKLFFSFFISTLSPFIITASPSLEIIPIKALIIGPESTSITRLTNLKEAVEILNKSLLKENKKIELKGEFFTGTHEDFRRRFILAFESQQAEDILLIGHEDISRLASQGFLADLTPYLKNDPKNFKDFFPSLWDSVKYKNKIYGIPQDTEVRMFYYRKDVLKALGWPDSKINAFPSEVEKGKITLFDIVKIAVEAQNKGLVKWGIYHRPTPGSNFFHFITSFQGVFEDQKNNHLVIDQKALLAVFNFFYELVHVQKVMPKEMIDLGWEVMDRAIPHKEILFNITGGSWNKMEYIKDQGMSEKDFNEKVGFCLIPSGIKGGKPTTLSHPLVYIVNNKSLQKNIIFKLLMKATDPDHDIKHAFASSHLAVRKSTSKMPSYQKDPFLTKATQFLKYTCFIPNHIDTVFFQNMLFEAIRSVESGRLSPQQALEQFTAEMKKMSGKKEILVK
ncbi:MAG: hypothetical protein A2Y41_00605 [Spirochaetes bacterium GWB1_36_13]|nr:MAG: hypothetical protein A2Y41_00605 [Spirochaetes bacterium GWB1_36_13]